MISAFWLLIMMASEQRSQLLGTNIALLQKLFQAVFIVNCVQPYSEITRKHVFTDP